jgi:hypothetical protein
MGAVEQTYARVESHLATIEEHYGSISVNQTTISVSPERFERERELVDDGCIDVYTRVEDDGEILHVESDEEPPELPSATADSVGAIEAKACSAVKAAAGIECTLTALTEATIVGIRDAEDQSRGTIYSLAVVFEATYEAGTPADDATWQAEGEKVPGYA